MAHHNWIEVAMFVYVFPYISNLSNRYHSGGGLVVVARDKAHVLELIHQEYDEDAWDDPHQPTISDAEWDRVFIYRTDSTAEPKTFFMLDAGCC